MTKHVWHLLIAVAVLGGAFALLRSMFGRLVLAGLLGALVGSLASVYGQLSESNRDR